MMENWESVLSDQAPRWAAMRLKGDSIDYIKEIFPDGEADQLNFILFSTSGISGSYCTIEDIEESIQKHGDTAFDYDECPIDYVSELTFIIVQPRIVGIRYGNISVKKDDIAYLKKLRESSWAAILEIGK